MSNSSRINKATNELDKAEERLPRDRLTLARPAASHGVCDRYGASCKSSPLSLGVAA